MSEYSSFDELLERLRAREGKVHNSKSYYYFLIGYLAGMGDHQEVADRPEDAAELVRLIKAANKQVQDDLDQEAELIKKIVAEGHITVSVGGKTIVGEAGPESVELPKGSYVVDKWVSLTDNEASGDVVNKPEDDESTEV